MKKILLFTLLILGGCEQAIIPGVSVVDKAWKRGDTYYGEVSTCGKIVQIRSSSSLQVGDTIVLAKFVAE